ncbi:MAG: O-antigen ligase family protein [Bacteroidales bacterium]|nr:O-antigen ligase family protein [Bacteroidales bacterium]
MELIKPVGHRYISIITVLLWGMLCISALFVVSEKFVNPEITPKRFGLVIGTGVAAVVWAVCFRDKVVSGRPVFLLLLFCVTTVFLRDWASTGFNSYLLAYSCCLLLLFFLLRQLTAVCAPEWLFGTAFILATFLSLYGVLQYFGVFLTSNRLFAVTGTFDNPAGFGAALSCVFPYGLYFFDRSVRRFKFVVAVMLATLAAGIALSGSRSSVMACLTAVAVYSAVGIPKLKFRWPIKIGAACLVGLLVFGLYLLKKDSADGRLLIWQCTWNMAKDSPIAGHGKGAFQAKYMLYQADYFEMHPDSKYAALADNVLHPFNEYLLILAEHGAIGIGILVLLGFLLIRSYRRSPDFVKLIAGLSLIAVAVFSCFSYPFKYPFTWLIVFLNIALIGVSHDKEPKMANPGRLIKAGTVAVSIVLFLITIPLINAEIIWNKTAKASMIGKTGEMLPEYNKLYRYLGKNGLFLYNHAAELNYIKKHEESLRVFGKCTKYYNDMDVQMLMADNYRALEQYDKAERHLKLAAGMCPGRFIPLYQLAKLYDETGREEEAVDLARQIIDKEVKIPSPTVIAIKSEMDKLIKTFKNIAPMEN